MTNVTPGPEIDAEARKLSSGMQLLLDLGPLVVFFATNRLAPGSDLDRIIVATGAFMAAMVIAMATHYALVKHFSKLQLFSAVLVFGFGAITIALRDDTFIKIKPTVYNLGAATILGVGVMMKKAPLKWLLGGVFPGLSQRGWMLYSRNWAIFFVAMACLNEVIWRNFSTDFWIGAKIWLSMPLTFLFAAANMPMLLRHGLTLEEKNA